MPQSLTHNGSKYSLQSTIGLIALLAMVLGFLLSRAILSIAMVVLFLNAFWPKTLSETWHRFKSIAFNKWALAYLLLYVLGGLWSENTEGWLANVEMKLPFLIMPFAMCSLPLYDEKYKRTIIFSILVMFVITVLVSLGIFIADWENYTREYENSNPIPTINTGDHIRFGLSLSLSIILIVYLLVTDAVVKNSRKIKIVLIAVGVLFVLYLHVLSAKTGLLILYFVLFTVGYYFVSKKWGKLYALALPLLLGAVFIVGAYFAIPTFQKKIDYVFLEIKMIKDGERLNYNYSDMGRLITYDIAFEQIHQQPLIGVGSGDVMQAMNEGYDKKYPDVPADTRFVPINQYLCEVLTFGWVLSLVFVGMVVSPFFYKRTIGSFFMKITALAFILSMMVEAMLQVQIGIFVYLFFTCLWFGFITPPKYLSQTKQSN